MKFASYSIVAILANGFARWQHDTH